MKVIIVFFREGHKYRRRRWRRLRILGSGETSMFESIDELRKSIDPENWEVYISAVSLKI